MRKDVYVNEYTHIYYLLQSKRIHVLLAVAKVIRKSVCIYLGLLRLFSHLNLCQFEFCLMLVALNRNHTI